jgi:hypothetical protein
MSAVPLSDATSKGISPFVVSASTAVKEKIGERENV